MSDQNSNAASDHEWDDGRELAWDEFDWERYLRAQDEVVQGFLAHYEKLPTGPARLDETASLMGWDEGDWSNDTDDDTDDPYTLHQNPVFIATRAIALGLRRDWERLAADPAGLPPPLAFALHAALGRAESQAMFALQALDFGDYALAISLFKRALHELNETFARLTAPAEPAPVFARHCADALPRLFDLREVWLRVINECRDELACPYEDDDEEE